MIKIKHVLDGLEGDDGERLWIEPIGLCKDLQEMCTVDHVLPHLGPPKKLWQWFSEHPDAYDVFRAKYHETLSRGPYRPALQALALAGRNETFTLVHQGDDPSHNTATALYEFLCELEAYCPPDADD